MKRKRQSWSQKGTVSSALLLGAPISGGLPACRGHGLAWSPGVWWALVCPSVTVGTASWEARETSPRYLGRAQVSALSWLWLRPSGVCLGQGSHLGVTPKGWG